MLGYNHPKKMENMSSYCARSGRFLDAHVLFLFLQSVLTDTEILAEFPTPFEKEQFIPHQVKAGILEIM